MTLKLQVCNLNINIIIFYTIGTNNPVIWVYLISVDLDNCIHPYIYKLHVLSSGFYKVSKYCFGYKLYFK